MRFGRVGFGRVRWLGFGMVEMELVGWGSVGCGRVVVI